MPSLGMMSLQLGLWTWSTVIKQDLSESLSCRVSGMASMSPSGCPQANFRTFVPVHQIPCLGNPKQVDALRKAKSEKNCPNHANRRRTDCSTHLPKSAATHIALQPSVPQLPQPDHLPCSFCMSIKLTVCTPAHISTKHRVQGSNSGSIRT